MSRRRPHLVFCILYLMFRRAYCVGVAAFAEGKGRAKSALRSAKGCHPTDSSFVFQPASHKPLATSRISSVVLLCSCALMLLCPCLRPAAAAFRAARGPQIGYAYPAGGRQASTFEMRLAGRYLDGVSGLVLSGGGAVAEVVEHIKPLSGRDIQLLRDRLKELQTQTAPPKQPRQAADNDTNAAAPIDRDAVQKEIAEIRRKLDNPKNRNRENPQLSEDVVLQVTLAPDAEPGRRELRLKTAGGLSNPVVFYVDRLPEYAEKESPDPEPIASLPVVVNGRIMPGDVDRFTLTLQEGRKVVMAVAARDLIPYLADAVPGWFQATLALYDANGVEVAYADDFRFDPDPVLCFDVPADGLYTLEIKDAVYRGREDFVYRITIGELPFITDIFPLGGPAGTETTVQLAGWNLPRKQLTVSADEPCILPISLPKAGLVSNRAAFAVDTLPEYTETNDGRWTNGAPLVPRPSSIVPLASLPVIINGRIDPPGDSDVFCFEGRAGQEIVAEVTARRLNSPLDSLLKLSDAAGQTLAVNNDYEDKAAGLATHHADSYLSLALPADGTYHLHIGDAQHQGGPAYAYRLRISEPRPDFELRIVPASVNVRAGASATLGIHALRKDGFAGDIRLSLTDAPQGFVLSPTRIPGNQEMVKLTLRAPAGRPVESLTLRVEGRADIQGRTITRTAVPAEDMMQAFFYRHLVPAQELQVAVLPRPAAANPARRPNAPANPRTTPATPPKSAQPQ